MNKPLIFALIFGLFLSGCCELAGAMGSEISTCMEKCNELCELVKENNFDLAEYNGIGLKKQSGATTISCNCPCFPEQD